MAFKQKKIIALEKAAKPLLVYDNGRSHYEFDGCHLDRITKVLSEMDDNEGLMAWRERVGEEVADMICKNAMARGSAVHKMVEAHLNNECMCQQKNGILANGLFQKMIPALERISNIAAVEVPVVSETYGIAGTADCIAEFDGELCIIDFKTSTQYKKPSWCRRYYLQECFYAVAVEEMTKIRIKTLVTIIVSEDGSVQVIKQDRKTWEDELDHLISGYMQKTRGLAQSG